ncbi:peptidase M16 inactive domain protein [Neorickettsia helminthoeca str. Oregon]|uniref:Peptidase M16 inactive domain protein n=1 Tax=Neorickettsia helminthoeca str. Oregon TaxID=1286528 RepID=X5HJ83_9RICK|nr:pitrilysin family protein [Neorickettsia helminthoeca]AHX11124.1 peptidase M16 inactive domain protein [Neorickettsia helminthoeca str. Oregon]
MQNLIQTRLTNGLSVFVDNIPGNYSVSIKIWVRAGSNYEQQENNGIAHFLEHMIFKGTKTRTAEQIAKDFDELGGHFNACTGKGYTIYYAKVLAEYLDKGMELLSDVLNNSVFPDVELQREKMVVLEEILQTEDTPDDIIFDRFFETIYPDQPYGRPILGSRDNVRNFTKNDLTSFISEHYYPENMMLIVSGGVDINVFLVLAEKYFADMKSVDVSKKDPAPAVYQPREYREERKLEQTHIILGFPGVSYQDSIAQIYSSKILTILLGASMSSRLFQEVREKRGLAYSISAFHSPAETSGIIGIYSSADPKKLTELVTVVLEELVRLESTLTMEEIERAKKQIKSSLLMGLESNESRASYIGKSFHYFGKYLDGETITRVINEITVQDVAAIANLMLTEKKVSLASIGAKDGLPEYEKLLDILK